ncbi:hypothetical protein TPHA_0I02220 [Tetrapisispora phaffii CBS 4417]|uniref:ATP-dependent DNA helicase n=1 Tax=Tetrapisispora phaffii (strain ATCC 24235 / CBS 4417 / NBRC 1672 / NRRL Y-8282 / UCD 70-5) TaxID=1071381 RepID=G8BXU8_TETPH|nr:hypothetical protein TPHA_0I02220 [Tetrapisispora phaffii CBS 4417]CCE64726.1 hypothetical protein TPHA_0I02220 [Tetrapisispora phaffii CBS 4417]
MIDNEDQFSDFEDDEFDSLWQKNINKEVTTVVTKRAIPAQRNLYGEVLPGQKTFYEEVQTSTVFKPTHHKLKSDQLGYYVYPTNFEVREYQYNIVKKALTENVLCAIPTGMGKTFIASTVMLNFFRWSETGKIIFTAPTRPLVAQQIKACLGITGIPYDHSAILLDKSRKNREEIWKEKRVFFTTPQVVENDLKRGVLDPRDIICLIIDEAHRATGSYAYCKLVQFIDRFNSSYRILALTATPGSEITNVQEVVNNLNISKIEIRTEESMDIAKYMKKRYKEKIEVSLTTEIEDIIEQIGIAITPTLQQAVELGIYDDCPPSYINAFVALQKSQQIILNPSLPEGIKWRNYFILQLLNHVGQMMKRIKIYGVITFYKYFQNKHKEFTTKYSLGKSTNKIAASFYYHPMIKTMMDACDKHVKNSNFVSHLKFQHIQEELHNFFIDGRSDSRVIIFTELRDSALEIVKYIDNLNIKTIIPHIFIGQAKGKEGFDEVEYNKKHKPKGRKKAERLKQREEFVALEEEKKKKLEKESAERSARRTFSSEEAQLKGMTQKQQKEVISDFKKGIYNVLVCTSIGEEGLDIGEVDLIICFDTTSSPIKNIQRMGRTGRKRDGKIVLLFASNESKKFEKAMESYYDLQKQIGQNFVLYKDSDRILPKDIEPECIKEFIQVGAENEEINNINDSDEVIRYATQCMNGKKPKKTKSSVYKKEKAASQKRFFMPDNVVTGIISANSLVRKVQVVKDPEIYIPSEHKPKEEFTLLDEIEDELFASQSPQKNDAYTNDVFLSDMPLNLVTSIVSKYDIPKIEPSNFTAFKKQTMTINKLESNSLTDTHELMTIDNVESNKTEKMIENVSLLSDDEEIKSIPKDSFVKVNALELDNKSIERSASKLKDSRMDSTLFKNKFRSSDGLLTKIEKLYFSDNYSPKYTVSIDTIPNLKITTERNYVAHNTHVQKILNIFKKMNENDTQTQIDINRSKCIARGIMGGNINLIDETDCNSSIISNSDISFNMRTSDDSTKLSSTQNEKLNELLDSDSDF